MAAIWNHVLMRLVKRPVYGLWIDSDGNQIIAIKFIASMI